MKMTKISTMMRWTASAACLTLILWGLPGCGGSEDGDGDDEADYAETSAGATDDQDADSADHHDDDDAAEDDTDHDEDGGNDGDADHDDDDDDDDDHAAGEHGEAVDYTAPETYAHAVEGIHAQLEKIEKLIGSRGLDRVHAEAAVIRDIANVIGRLALKDGSGVPRDAVREINLAAKALAATFGPIDEAGDSDDLAGTQTVYDEMMALFETLEKFAPEHDDDDDDH